MDLGAVVVLILALLFFGGVGFLVWSERKKQRLKSSGGASMVQPTAAEKDETAQGRRRAH